jgi:ATP-dependent RNA helicase HelY
MWAWASGWPWEKVIHAGQMAEGDLAMLILRTADHLRHIRTLGRVFSPLAASAGEAVDRILREPVMPERPGPQTDDHRNIP